VPNAGHQVQPCGSIVAARWRQINDGEGESFDLFGPRIRGVGVGRHHRYILRFVEAIRAGKGVASAATGHGRNGNGLEHL
jgi:hypothetical protein